MPLRLGPAKGKDTANSRGPTLVTPDELEPFRSGQAFDLADDSAEAVRACSARLPSGNVTSRHPVGVIGPRGLASVGPPSAAACAAAMAGASTARKAGAR